MSEITAETVLTVAVLLLLLVIILWAMARSWRSKQSESTAALPSLPTRPAEPGRARTNVLPGVYVASTPAGSWMVRVPGHGLGTRSPAEVQVHDVGVTITRQGAQDVFVPTADLVDAHRSAGMTGKYVGGEGLVVLRWRLHGTDDPGLELDTGLHLRRSADRGVLTEAVQALVADREHTVPPSSEETR
jgi:hypothetical protein